MLRSTADVLRKGSDAICVKDAKEIKSGAVVCGGPNFSNIFDPRIRPQEYNLLRIADFVFVRHCNNSLFLTIKNTAVSGDTAGVINIKCPAPYALDGGRLLGICK